MCCAWLLRQFVFMCVSALLVMLSGLFTCMHLVCPVGLECWLLPDNPAAVSLACCCCLQDNEPLMRALSNLISLNQPELVLFVGEALVGNDAVDQLVKFNRSLADLAPGAAAGEQQCA
jgi:hypothetical protein